jgi:eukaryotic-like serine/threonine-protein kinase
MDTVFAATGAVPPPGEGASSGAGPRRIVGPYKILSEIGRGGMGVVYRALHPGLKRIVALKVLIAGEDASEEAIARFHREAEAVAKIGHHPHIVPVYDIGTEGRLHYFAMHFVEGPSLDRWIDEEAIAPRRAAQIARKVAEALAHAHRHGILHRDVKPANILMATGETDAMRNPKPQIPNPNEIPDPKSQRPPSEGESPDEPRRGTRHPPLRDPRPSTFHSSASSDVFEPMLTDFGLAKDIRSEEKVTRSGTALGSPNYRSPEQAEIAV